MYTRKKKKKTGMQQTRIHSDVILHLPSPSCAIIRALVTSGTLLSLRPVEPVQRGPPTALQMARRAPHQQVPSPHCSGRA